MCPFVAILSSEQEVVRLRIAVTLLAFAAVTSCRTSRPLIVQPGIPGAPSRAIARNQAVDLSRVQHTDADVRFMQRMIHHHAQALDMTTLLAARTTREDMRMLARRIELSQADEIKMMQRWLELRGREVPDEHAHHKPDAPLMPGMLTAEEIGRLAESKDATFDRLFLEFMIRHHAGALLMVAELFSTPGAAQESEVYAFASEVESDQRTEIDRMGAMLMMEIQK